MRPLLATSTTAPGIRPRSTSARNTAQMRARRSEDSPTCSGFATGRPSAPTTGAASSETVAQKIYSASRASPTPEVKAAATIMLVTTLLIVSIGLLLYRRFTRGQAGGGVADLAQL